MSRRVKIAACQYPIDFLDSWEAYEEKIRSWVEDAVSNGARLLVFPEYAPMELTSLLGKPVYSNLARQLEALQDLLPQYRALFEAQARSGGVYLLAGSFPVLDDDGLYRNRAYFFGPEGLIGQQDKLQMTRFERESWMISAGREFRLFETEIGRIGINICYDIEFPLIARRFVEAGAEILLAPSCTDCLAGYYRVRTACRARALENQCYVVQSPTVGKAEWSEAVDINIGAAAIYTPIDNGFSSDGVLQVGTLDQAQWVYGDIDLEKIEWVRKEGQVLIHRDWAKQGGILNLPLERHKVSVSASQDSEHDTGAP